MEERVGEVSILKEGATNVGDGVGAVNGDSREERNMRAAVGVGADVGEGGMGEENEGDGGRVSTAVLLAYPKRGKGRMTDFSISERSSVLNGELQPQSTRILMPLSKRSTDAEALLSDCAPSKGMK